MTLTGLVLRIGFVVGVMLILASVGIVGRSRLSFLHVHYRDRLRSVAPYLVLLGGVLILNSVTRKAAPEISWVFGWRLTGAIYAIEGSFVADLQAYASPLLTAYLSFMYVYGYVFLLVFPLIAYLALDELQYLREASIAYTLNYGLGLLCYVLFIAYGPRNLMPDMVDSLLYSTWPQSQLLTSQVNTNSNVFPSLHSALSVTVAIFAYRTRDIYPAWLVIAAVLAGSIAVSTMYLGIHWLTDVVGGGLLALLSVALSFRLEETVTGRIDSRTESKRGESVVGRYARRLREWTAMIRRSDR